MLKSTRVVSMTFRHSDIELDVPKQLIALSVTTYKIHSLYSKFHGNPRGSVRQETYIMLKSFTKVRVYFPLINDVGLCQYILNSDF